MGIKILFVLTIMSFSFSSIANSASDFCVVRMYANFTIKQIKCSLSDVDTKAKKDPKNPAAAFKALDGHGFNIVSSTYTRSGIVYVFKGN